jgi:SAM-dependent methyltransferase
MGLRTLIGKLIFQWPRTWLYRLSDRIYLGLDRSHVRRTRNICHIPNEGLRRGGKYSYAEWAHVIGIFQTLICLYRPKPSANQILDVGCGTGILAIAAEPFVQDGGKYVGIDIGQEDVRFCREHYASPYFDFVHLDVSNPEYAPNQADAHLAWPINDESFDVVTALSVWTHMSEADAKFYLQEVCRVIRPTGKAIITLFILDENYERKLAEDQSGTGQFHNTPKETWIFDQVSYGSDNFRHPQWAEVPEAAIAIRQSGLDRLLAEVGLAVVEQHSGNWKEVPGLYFQDVVILKRVEKGV